jgi:pimeloyl-ACP methyl ester carboxylesterase
MGSRIGRRRRWGMLARPEVTRGAILGHSMGSIGALLAAAADPRVTGVAANAGEPGGLRSMASVVTGAPVRGETAAQPGPRQHQGET